SDRTVVVFVLEPKEVSEGVHDDDRLVAPERALMKGLRIRSKAENELQIPQAIISSVQSSRPQLLGLLRDVEHAFAACEPVGSAAAEDLRLACAWIARD